MKKTLKSVFAIVLVLTLILAMGITANATVEYKITVENTNSNISISGKTYKAYKVFDLTLGTISYSPAASYDANETYYTRNEPTYTVATVANEDAFKEGTFYTMSSVGAYAIADSYDANETYYTYEGPTYTVATVADEGAFNEGTFYTMSVGAYAYSIKSTDWAFNTLTADATDEYKKAASSEVTEENLSNYYIKSGETYTSASSYDSSTAYYKKTGWTLTKYGIKYQSSVSDTNTYIIDGNTMTEANARALADALTSSLPENAAATGTVSNGSEKTVLNVGEPGYYAVYGEAAPKDPKGSETVVAALGLTTAAPAQTVNPKAEVPTLDKKITNVNEATTTSTQDVRDAILDENGKAAVAKVGSTVSFEIDSSVPDITGYDKYIFTISDNMSTGLSFIGSDTEDTINTLKVYIQTAVADETAFSSGIYYIKNGSFSKAAEYKSGEIYYTQLTITDNYTITHTVGTKSFTLTILKDVLAAHSTNDAIAVTYDAIVNSSSLNVNYDCNTAKLTYSNDPSDSSDSTPSKNDTPERKVYVLNINIDVKKVATDADGAPLSDASFKLYRIVDGNVEYYKWDDTNKKVTWTANKDEGDTFTTKPNGAFDTQVCGLDKGTYYLIETKAPNGYNLLSTPVEITITAKIEDEKVTYTAVGAVVTNGTVVLGTANENQPLATSTIINNSGGAIPSTGGIGTVILYIVGGALTLCSGILLVVRRKVNSKQAAISKK